MPKKLVAFIHGVLYLAVIFGSILFPKTIRAENQICSVGTTCVVGEFLYDDNYSPINSDATCTLTSKNPNGTSFLNGVNLSIGSSDGWYSYGFSTDSLSTGLYPSQVCCTIGVGTTEYMCTDKSFTVLSAGSSLSSSDVANAVWQSGGRTLTDFGSISTDISSIKSTVSSIDTKVDSIGTSVSTLISKWGSYSASDIITNIGTINTNLGTNSDTCSTNSVFGNIACVKDKWGSQTAQALYDAANNALTTTNSIRSELAYNGKSTTAYEDIQTLKNYVDSLENSIGLSSDSSSTSTLFGRIKATNESIGSSLSSLSVGVSNVQVTLNLISSKIDSLDTKVDSIGTSVSTLISKWGSYSASDIITNIGTINTNLGTNSDTCSTNSVFGNIACVKDKWGSQTAQALYDAANNALTTTNSIRSELAYNGKSTTAYEDIQTLKNYVDSLENSIGDDSDLSTDATLFGKLKDTKNDISNIPANVWGYTARTLTSFGSLVADIWSYTTRSLTTFGSLIADVWGNSIRTLTHSTLNTGNLATNESIGSSLSSLSVGVSNVQVTLNLISSKIDSLDTKVDSIGTSVSTLISKWGSYSASDIITNIGTINTNLGTNSDTCSTNSVFGNIACVKDKWGSQTAQALYDAANNALTTTNSIRSELAYNGKSTTAYEDIQNLNTNISTLNGLIGSSSDSSSVASLFGKLKNNKEDIAVVSGQVAGVQTTINEINTKVSSLNTQTIGVGNSVALLLSKWGNYSIADVLSNINNITNILGSSSDICSTNETVFGNIACVKDKWGSQTADTLYTAVNNTYSTINSLRSELNYTGKSTTAYQDLQTLKSNLSSLNSLIGSSDDSSSTSSLFGKIKKVQTTVDALSGISSDADAVIDNWGNLTAADIYDKVKNLSSEISAINTVSNVNSILDINKSSQTDLSALKNEILSIKALTNVNQILLEKTVNQPVIKTWLEEGSIIFKTMITNPSSTKQSVPLKFYLPKEVKEKDIMKIDPGVSVAYDTSAESLYITGNFTLSPNDTKILSVEVTDIWKVSDTEISSLKMQTEELSKPLVNTAYFAQGVTLKSDILASLENIQRKQKEAVTPEARIEAYRENLITLEKIKNELKDLQSLVSSLSSTNSVTGFVGGAQTLSLWGMILIIIVSVISVTLYMKIIIVNAPKKEQQSDKVCIRRPSLSKNIFNSSLFKVIGLSIIAVIIGITVFRLTWNILDAVTKKKTANQAIIKTEEAKRQLAQINNDSNQVLGEFTQTPNPIGKVIIVMPTESTSSVKVRQNPDLNADILAKIWSKQKVDLYEEKNDWIKIGLNINIDNTTKYITGWVRSQFVEK